MSNSQITYPLPTIKSDYLRGFEVKDEGNLVCTDLEALEN